MFTNVGTFGTLAVPSSCPPAKRRTVSFPRFYCVISADGYGSVVLALWNGDIVQKNNEDHDIDCWCYFLLSSTVIDNFPDVIYRESRPTSFLDPSRLAVPK